MEKPKFEGFQEDEKFPIGFIVKPKFEEIEEYKKSPEEYEKYLEDKQMQRINQAFRARLQDNGINVDEDLLRAIEDDDGYITDKMGAHDRQKKDQIKMLVNLRKGFVAQEKHKKAHIERFLGQLKNNLGFPGYGSASPSH